MKYKNANDVLPETLLAELQKYAAGELLPIPQLKERRKSWGESSGTRQYLRKRNQEIRDRFGQGQTVDELSDAYSLSPDSIRKIIYAKPNGCGRAADPVKKK